MEIGYTWDRKDWEYTVVAKVPHKGHDGRGVFVYMIEQRKFGEEEYEYFTTVKN